jgi:hypothetical protein
MDKIMQALENWGIEFICVGYIERTSTYNSEYSSSFSLQSVVLV